jgi:hypothetical protein
MAKRVRTGWRVRQGYKLAQWAGATLGGCIGLAVVAAAYASLADPRLAASAGFVLQSAALAAGGALVPWLVVGWLWRREQRRNLWDWQ